MNRTKKLNFWNRRYIVHRRLQYKIIGFFFWLGIMSSGMFGLAFWSLYRNLQIGVASLGDRERAILHDVVARLSGDTMMMMIVYSLIVLIYFTVGGLFFSHLIAGPLFRLRRQLQSMATDENPDPVQFRKGDMIRDLAPDVNRVSDRIRDFKKESSST